MKLFAGIVTGSRTAWVVLLTCLLALGLALALVPHPSDVALTNPATAGDSGRVARWQADVPAADLTNGLVVWTRTDGHPLTASEQAAVKDRVAALAALSPRPASTWTQLSNDRTVVLAVVPMQTSEVLADAPTVADSLRHTAGVGLPGDVRVRLTGQIATLAANASAIHDAADWALLVGLIVLAALLLILGSRSLVLWPVPLVLVVAAAGLSQLVATDVGAAIGLPLSPGDAPLVFGVTVGLGTAFSLVYILRYRSELRRVDNRFEAGARAWLGAAPGIAISSLILALGVLVLLFAADSRVRALGLAMTIGIVLVALTILLAVPAGLVEFGRRGFWPSIPTAANGGPGSRIRWERAVRAGQRRTILATFGTAVVLGAITTGITAGFVTATAPAVDTHAGQARASIDRAFTPGYGNQAIMIVPNSLKGETSVVAPTSLAMAFPQAHAVTVGPSHEGRAALFVDLDVDPGSAKALATIQALRTQLAATGGPTAATLVGGPDAATLDRMDAANADLETVVPIAIVLAILLLFLADLVERRKRN
jgi:RND superfamily putative drug exporter